MDYDAFNLDNYNDDEYNAYFRFKKNDLFRLKHALDIPDRVKLKNCSMEALCVILSRFAFPTRFGDMIKTFGRSVPQLCLIVQKMTNHLDDQYAVKLTTLNHQWLQPARLQEYAAAVAKKGSLLQTELEQYSHDLEGNILSIYGDPAYHLRAQLQAPFEGNLAYKQGNVFS